MVIRHNLYEPRPGGRGSESGRSGLIR